MLCKEGYLLVLSQSRPPGSEWVQSWALLVRDDSPKFADLMRSALIRSKRAGANIVGAARSSSQHKLESGDYVNAKALDFRFLFAIIARGRGNRKRLAAP